MSSGRRAIWLRGRADFNTEDAEITEEHGAEALRFKGLKDLDGGSWILDTGSGSAGRLRPTVKGGCLLSTGCSVLVSGCWSRIESGVESTGVRAKSESKVDRLSAIRSDGSAETL